MFYCDKSIHELIDDGVILNADHSNVGQISYDLNTKEFYYENCRMDKVILKPANSIFAGSVETLRLPDNIAATVTLRNKWIRAGLLLDAPVYFPSHETTVYFRLTNLSGNPIELDSKEVYAQIYFTDIDHPIQTRYEGIYKDEFQFPDTVNLDVYRADKRRIEKALKPFNKIENRLYGNVLTLMAIFFGISVVAQTVISRDNSADLAVTCLVQCGCFSFLFYLITLLVGDNSKVRVKQKALYLAFGCFAMAFVFNLKYDFVLTTIFKAFEFISRHLV